MKGGGRGRGVVVVVVTNVVADMISSALLYFVFLNYVDDGYTYSL